MGSVKRAFLGAGILHAKKLFSDGKRGLQVGILRNKPILSHRQAIKR